jgi:hypothetical protein
MVEGPCTRTPLASGGRQPPQRSTKKNMGGRLSQVIPTPTSTGKHQLWKEIVSWGVLFITKRAWIGQAQPERTTDGMAGVRRNIAEVRPSWLYNEPLLPVQANAVTDGVWRERERPPLKKHDGRLFSGNI